mgnify:FL=1
MDGASCPGARPDERGKAAVKRKKTALLALAALFALLLCGCFAQPMEELYALPRQSDDYNNLQQAIDAVMAAGTTYCAPATGSNQQPVQLADLDGDGEDEAIVFLKASDEKPLKLYLFDLVDGAYQNIAVIEGSGSMFDRVEYVELDGEPGAEIVVGRQVSDQVLQALGVYALRDGHIVELLSCNYTEYTVADLTNDGVSDLFVLRFDAEERTGVAELYTYNNGMMEREPEASMSTGVNTVKRIISGSIGGNVPAVLVASTYDDASILTDVFAVRDGTFCNLTAGSNSATTVRNYYVYATDIDADGVIELPDPELLPSAQGADSGDAYWIIHWYSLSLDGSRTRKMTTYHNYSGGWYVILPDAWGTSLTVSRLEEYSGVRGYVFSQWYGAGREPEEIFTIYAFTGDDRAALAAADGRFVLGEKGDVTYAASLGTAPRARELTREGLITRFGYIRVDWNTGEM